MKTHGLIWAGLFVENLEAAVVFYRDQLGLPLRSHGADFAHFDAGEGALFEVFSGGKAVSGPKGPELQPLVVSFRVDDLPAAMQELKAKGVSFIGEMGEYKGTRWASFCDPEGNLLELKQI